MLHEFPIKGAAHITGGGIVGNLPRVLPRGARALIAARQLAGAADIRYDSKDRAVSQDEMDRTFNNGLGMILVVGSKHADGVHARAQQSGRSDRL